MLNHILPTNKSPKHWTCSSWLQGHLMIQMWDHEMRVITSNAQSLSSHLSTYISFHFLPKIHTILFFFPKTTLFYLVYFPFQSSFSADFLLLSFELHVILVSTLFSFFSMCPNNFLSFHFVFLVITSFQRVPLFSYFYWLPSLIKLNFVYKIFVLLITAFNTDSVEPHKNDEETRLT